MRSRQIDPSIRPRLIEPRIESFTVCTIFCRRNSRKRLVCVTIPTPTTASRSSASTARPLQRKNRSTALILEKSSYAEMDLPRAIAARRIERKPDIQTDRTHRSCVAQSEPRGKLKIIERDMVGAKGNLAEFEK